MPPPATPVAARQASQSGPVLIVLWMVALACFRYGMTHGSFLQQPPQLSDTEIAITPNAPLLFLAQISACGKFSF